MIVIEAISDSATTSGELHVWSQLLPKKTDQNAENTRNQLEEILNSGTMNNIFKKVDCSR